MSAQKKFGGVTFRGLKSIPKIVKILPFLIINLIVLRCQRY